MTFLIFLVSDKSDFKCQKTVRPPESQDYGQNNNFLIFWLNITSGLCETCYRFCLLKYLKFDIFPIVQKKKNISLWNPDPKVQKMARISHFYIWMQSCEFRCKKSPDEVFDTKIGPTTVHQKLFEPNRWKKQLSFRKVNIFLGNVSKSLPPVLENSGQLCFFSDFRNVRNPKNALFWTGPLSGQKRKRQLIINAKG